MGVVRAKNCTKLRDVIYGRPLRHPQSETAKDVWQDMYLRIIPIIRKRVKQSLVELSPGYKLI
jgi:hypothetical protein